MAKQKNELATIKENTLNNVQNRIAELQQGGFKLPASYSAQNALQSAWLLLQDVKTRDGKSALEACSKNSIAMSLFKMVQMGLNPAKNQCYFIPYGDNLICMTSYFGQVLIAKRAGLKEVKANLILEGDDFNFKIDESGKKIVTTHNQDWKNLSNKIIGAYCVITFPDNTQDTEIMTSQEIKESWKQGATKGNSPAHKNFEGEMAKRTVTNRAIKMFVNSSDDSAILDDPAEQIANANDAYVQQQIEDNANKKEISVDASVEDIEINDAETVTDEPEAVIDSQGQATMPGF